MPRRLEPMLAELSRQLPTNDKRYGFELKWDGYRALVYLDRGRIQVLTRRQQDYTSRLPGLRALAESRAGQRLVLDGELVALLPGGRTSFHELHNLIGPRLGPQPQERGSAGEAALVYLAFDLLYLDGRTLLHAPYRERRLQLEALELAGPAWWVPPSQQGGGGELLETSQRLGSEGVVAKRLDSSYRPGIRSSDWLKIKRTRRQEFVIVGWMPALGVMADRIGSLLLAYYDLTPDAAQAAGRPQRLLYAGRVGTGFNRRTLDELMGRLAPLRADRSPLDEGAPPPIAQFVRPTLVCEVEFWEWSPGGEARHSSFRGLRPDKPTHQVIREA